MASWRWGQAAVAALLIEWMGMTPGQASSELGCSPAQVRELYRTFCAFPEPSSRAQDLSFRHHQIAARTADPQGWLDQALKNGWSTRQFQEAVRAVEDPVDQGERDRQKALCRGSVRAGQAGGPGAGEDSSQAGGVCGWGWRSALVSASLRLIRCEAAGLHPVERAALLHWKLLVHVHPFTDGNGRTARLLMNFSLMRDGYPPAVIKVDDRGRYLESLEAASVSGDMVPFVGLVAEAAGESLERWLGVVEPYREHGRELEL